MLKFKSMFAAIAIMLSATVGCFMFIAEKLWYALAPVPFWSAFVVLCAVMCWTELRAFDILGALVDYKWHVEHDEDESQIPQEASVTA